MRFFSRITFIFNFCFLVSVVMRLVEMGSKVKVKGNTNGIVHLNPFVSSIAVLGITAIFVNIFFVILFIARFSSKRMNNIPRWIVYFNLILLPMQIYYFFFSKF